MEPETGTSLKFKVADPRPQGTICEPRCRQFRIDDSHAFRNSGGSAIHLDDRGDESLSRRPMERIMKPLREMGATIEAETVSFHQSRFMADR